MASDTTARRRRRLRRGRAPRCPRGREVRARHSLRGRRPARRARRHPRRRRRDVGDRHRLHRPQRAHLPDPAAPLRRARRRDPGVGDVALGLRRRDRPGVGRCARRARTVPRGRQPATSRLPADAGRDPALPPPRPGRPRDDRRGPDAARVPGRGPVLGVLRTPLHGAGRRRRVVVRPGPRAGVPGALPLHVPPAPRDARHLRVADLAHRDRWLTQLRRARRGRAARHPHRHQGDLGAGDAHRRGGHRRQRRDRDVRRVRGRDAPRPGPRHARRADRAAARAAHRPAVLGERPRCSTPMLRCCRGPRARARRGTSVASPRRPAGHAESP